MFNALFTELQIKGVALLSCVGDLGLFKPFGESFKAGECPIAKVYAILLTEEFIGHIRDVPL